VNSAIGFRFQLRPFRDRIGMAYTSSIAYRKSTSKVAHLVDKFSVRVREVECLNETQARTARWCFIHPVCFQTAAIRHDDERSRCHKRITDKCCPRRKSCASRSYNWIRCSRQECAAKEIATPTRLNLAQRPRRSQRTQRKPEFFRLCAPCIVARVHRFRIFSPQRVLLRH